MIFILSDVCLDSMTQSVLEYRVFFIYLFTCKVFPSCFRWMSAAADLTPPCYLPAFGSAAFCRQPHSVPPWRLNLMMMIGQMTGPGGLPTASSPQAAISLLCPTTTAAASCFPPGGSLCKVVTTRPSITTHSRQSLSV